MKSLLILAFLFASLDAFSAPKQPLMAMSTGTIGQTSTQVLAADTYGNRRCLSIQNQSAANYLIYKFDSAHTANEGYLIAPLSAKTWPCDNAPKNAIYLKASSGTETYTIEYEY